MKKQLTKMLGLLLVLAMCFSLMPISALAATEETELPAIEQTEEVTNDEMPGEIVTPPDETPPEATGEDDAVPDETLPEATGESDVLPDEEPPVASPTEIPEDIEQAETGMMVLAAGAAQVKIKVCEKQRPKDSFGSLDCGALPVSHDRNQPL